MRFKQKLRIVLILNSHLLKTLKMRGTFSISGRVLNHSVFKRISGELKIFKHLRIFFLFFFIVVLNPVSRTQIRRNFPKTSKNKRVMGS